MKITYTLHARRRMKQRGVREQDVEIILLLPDDMCQTPEPSVRYMRTMTDGRTLKVWTVPPDSDTSRIVKSATWKDEDDDE